jgi:hypothetical protein
MIKRKLFTFIILGILAVTSQSCNLPVPAPATQPPPSIDPLAAAQLTVAAAQTAGAVNTSPSAAPPPTLTPVPTFTFTPAFSPTPALTSTPSFPYITLSTATNCRTGPGKAFDLIDLFNPGQTIEVLGKNPTGEYWYVRSPNNPAVFCWMWGFYATGGNLNNIAMFTPPATPTPAPTYEATYAGLDACVGWWVEVTLKNVGTSAFKSFSISVKDTVTGVTLSSSSEEFTNLDGCLTTNSISKLDPGEIYTVSSPAFTADPTGHIVKATLTLCTEKSLGGQCSVKNIEFKP